MNIENISTKSYPEIKVEQQNPFYGTILLQNYAGEVSETTQIAMYFYQQIIHESTNPILAKTLEKIRDDEIKHLKMLARLIYLLGIDPKYKTTECFQESPTYWKAQQVKYEKDEQKLLEINIYMKKQSIQKYRNHIDIIQDKFVQKTLKRILLDENLHLQAFKKLLKQEKTVNLV